MPCRSDGYECNKCGQCSCVCNDPYRKKWGNFDFEGALCDVLELIEGWRDSELLAHVDRKTLEWWGEHEVREHERIKKEALAKLSPRERRALGLK